MSTKLSSWLFKRFEHPVQLWLFKMVRLCIIGLVLGVISNMTAKALNGGEMLVTIPGTLTDNSLSTESKGVSKGNLARILGDWILIETTPSNNHPLDLATRIIYFPLGKSVLASPGDILLWIFLPSTYLFSILLLLTLPLPNKQYG